jgi:hypothetical protein
MNHEEAARKLGVDGFPQACPGRAPLRRDVCADAAGAALLRVRPAVPHRGP